MTTYSKGRYDGKPGKSAAKSMQGGMTPATKTDTGPSKPKKPLPTDVKPGGYSPDHKEQTVSMKDAAKAGEEKLPMEIEKHAKGAERTVKADDSKLVGIKDNWMHNMTKSLEKSPMGDDK